MEPPGPRNRKGQKMSEGEGKMSEGEGDCIGLKVIVGGLEGRGS